MSFLSCLGVVFLILSIFSAFYDLLLGFVLFITGFSLFILGTNKKGNNKQPTNEDDFSREFNQLPSHSSPQQHQVKPVHTVVNNDLIPSYYIVFDIETTGLSRSNDRIIEIAANAYRNGLIVKQYHTYVNPMVHIPISITRLTGIRDEEVKNAPTINKVKQDFLSFIGSAPLVGHNILTFDIPFLEAQFHATIPNKKYDTLRIAKKAFPDLPSYKLTYLDQALHLGGLEHHRAENDIAINNALFIACSTPWQYQYLLTKSALSKIEIEPPRTLYSSIPISSISPTNPKNAKCTGLTGKTIAFTGEILTPRRDAMQMAVDAGAILKSGVSKNLDYLVAGEQNSKEVGESCMSTKQLKAMELIEAGDSKLKIIDESEFFSLLNEISVV